MYTEEKLNAAPFRKRLVDELDAYIISERAKCNEKRRAFFSPDTSTKESYEGSCKELRNELAAMLGAPLGSQESATPTKAEHILISDEGNFTIERLIVEVSPGLSSYGLLFVPKGEGKHPYVSVLHGGAGTCEIVSSLYNSANYRDLAMRIMKKTNAVIYAPQIMLWSDEYNRNESEKSDNIGRDLKLKQIGSSMAAIEIFKIIRTVDYIIEYSPIDRNRMGIAGLSYGGFYALACAALDTRYKATLSSGFFNNRFIYHRGDWVWFDSGSKFLDVEIAKLICPRALCVEVGEKDHLFAPDEFDPLSSEVENMYYKLGVKGNFRAHMHPGAHEVCSTDENIDWFVERLLN